MVCTMTVPRVYIKGLGNSGDKDEIRTLFSEFGPLKNVWIATKPPGFAYVFYESFDDAEKAVQYYNNKEVCGKLVSVELSPIESKYKEKEQENDGDANEEADAASVDNQSNYEEVEDVYYESDPDTKEDYEREKFHESHYQSMSREQRDDRRRNDTRNYRGRPYDRQRGARRGGYVSGFRDRDDNRRRSFPDRRGIRGRGRGSYNRREHGRDMYRDAGSTRGYRQRGRADVRPNYERRHRGSQSNYTTRGNYERERGFRRRSEFGARDQFRGGNRSHGDNPHYERKRPQVDRFPSSPPPPKRTLGPSVRKRTLGSPVRNEFMPRDYRMRQSGAQSNRHREFVEGTRSNRRNSDMDYRQQRKMIREEQWASREKEHYKRPADVIQYEKYPPKKSYRHSDETIARREEYQQHHRRKSLDKGYHRPTHHGVDSYRSGKYSFKSWETSELRNRSPHYSPEAHYPKRYASPTPHSPEVYGYSNLQRELSRSRSRSVSSHVETSDTSRGPSASPSPPHHKQSLLYRTPSRSRSRSLSPMPGRYNSDYQPRQSTQMELGSPPYSLNSLEYRSPSPQLSRHSPTYAPHSPAYQPHSPVYPPPLSPGVKRHIDHRPREYFKEKRQVEFDRKKNFGGDYDSRNSKREVNVRGRERKISYDEKRGSDRFVQVGSRHSGEKREHTRPLSESFDTFSRSSTSRHISPPPPPPPPPPPHPSHRRSHTSPRRKRSGHLEEVDGHTRRNISRSRSPPMSSKMMRGH